MASTTDLTEEQQRAVRLFFSPKPKNAIFIITGGPGTGKTTVLEHLYSPVLGMKHLILTKSWCAASHIQSVTGIDAIAIDKMDFSSPLTSTYKHCILIMEESSMISVETAASIISDLEPIKLIIVGDVNQLECQSGCSLLSTMLAASQEEGGNIPVVRLTKNLRQKGVATALIENIASLGKDDWSGPIEDETFIIKRFATTEEATAAAAGDFTSASQMIAFTNSIVDQLNDQTASRNIDRVICTNTVLQRKKIKVANGVMGVRSEDGNSIKFKNGFVEKKKRSNAPFASNPVAARCVTTHRLQGSEFDETGLLVLSWFKGGLSAKLIYTAISRFKKKVVVYGERRLVDAAFKAKFSPSKVDMEVVSLLKEIDLD